MHGKYFRPFTNNRYSIFHDRWNHLNYCFCVSVTYRYMPSKARIQPTQSHGRWLAFNKNLATKAPKLHSLLGRRGGRTRRLQLSLCVLYCLTYPYKSSLVDSYCPYSALWFYINLCRRVRSVTVSCCRCWRAKDEEKWHRVSDPEGDLTRLHTLLTITTTPCAECADKITWGLAKSLIITYICPSTRVWISKVDFSSVRCEHSKVAGGYYSLPGTQHSVVIYVFASRKYRMATELQWRGCKTLVSNHPSSSRAFNQNCTALCPLALN